MTEKMEIERTVYWYIKVDNETIFLIIALRWQPIQAVQFGQ